VDEVQYLVFKSREETALNVLYGSVSAAMAAAIASSTLSSVLYADGNPVSGAGGLPVSSVNWPRVAMLIRRACDTRLWSDVEGCERANLDGNLYSALCAPHIAREPRLMAVVLALTRYLLRCGRNHDNFDDAERGYRDYDKWLGRVGTSASKSAVKTLCTCMSDLVPIEPTRYLKSSLKILFRIQSLRDLVRDYLALARTRTADLDAAGNGDANDRIGTESATAKADRTVKSSLDVAKFVAEFTRADNVMPSMLVRQMNFHRYHFRSGMLETLLSPDLVPSSSFLHREFPRGGLLEFNSQRIAMIEVMAFKRKDKAITRAEATPAIQSIREKMKVYQFAAANPRGQTQESCPINHRLSEESPLLSLIQGLADAIDASDHNNTGLVEKSSSQSDADQLTALLASKLFGLVRGEHADLLDAVSSFLHSVLKTIDMCKPLVVTDKSVDSQDESQLWLGRTFSWLRTLLLNVVGDCRLARFQRALQSRILILLCMQSTDISADHVSSLAVLLFTLSSLSGEASLQDMSYVFVTEDSLSSALTPATTMQHIISTIADNLALGTARQVLRSMQFSVTYSRFVLACPRPLLVCQAQIDLESKNEVDVAHRQSLIDEESLIPCSQSTCNDAELISNRSDHYLTGFHYIEPALIRLMRWVTSSPWRMFDIPSLAGKPEIDKDTDWNSISGGRERSQHANECLAAFRDAIPVLTATACADVKLGITDWTAFELRAGWGREEEAISVLLQFASHLDCSCSIFGCVAQVISQHVASVHQPSQAFSSASEARPNWLVHALQSVARESSCAFSLQSSHIPVFEAFEDCVFFSSHDFASAAGRAMLDLVRHLPPELYFGACTAESVSSHISRAVAPALWPLSASDTKTILVAYLSWHRSLSCDDSNGTRGPPDVPFALLAACCIQWKHLENLAANFEDPTLDRARRISALISSVLHGDSVCDEDIGGTQSSIDMRHIVREEPLLVATTFVYNGYFDSGILSAVAQTIRQQNAHTFLGRLTSWQELYVVDLLDTAIDISARCPFALRHQHDSSDCLRIAQWSMTCLVDCVEARIQLLEFAATELLSIRNNGNETSDSNSPCAVAAFADLGLAGARPQRQRRKAEAWTSNKTSIVASGENDVEALLDCIAVGRIASAVGIISEQALAALEAFTCANGRLSLATQLAAVYVRIARAAETLGRSRPSPGHIYQALMPGIERDIESALIRELIRLPADAIGVTQSPLNSDLQRLNPGLWDQIVGKVTN
jgi:hypothetical protein